MQPLEKLIWLAKPTDIPTEDINAARMELVQLRADLATEKHNHQAVLAREAELKARIAHVCAAPRR
jgi:hypothetical protein